jgi:hypothetical protein
MKLTMRWMVVFGVVCAVVLLWWMRTDRDTVAAQTRKPIVVTRLFTGPDGLTHAEDIEVKLTGDRQNEISEMFKVKGAELHRTPPGKVNSWHVAPRRQYVITLSGKGEIELAGGKKILLEPGHIELAEDLTGKGHITRVVGNEDRVTIQLPLADEASH